MAKYEIIQDLLPLGREHNRPGIPLNPQGIEIHDTDTKGATDENERTYEGNGYHGSSAHIFIDWDSIRQIIPDNEQAWGAGPTANGLFIHLEMCVPPSHDPEKFHEVWNRTVWCVAYKCIQYSWSTGPDVWSHRGTSARWHETDHQDPIAFLAEYGESWESLLAAIDTEIERQKGEIDMKLNNVVLYFGDADLQIAADMALVLKCPVMQVGLATPEFLRSVEDGGKFQVGGSTAPEGVKLLAGDNPKTSDRFDTIKSVLKAMGKI